MLQNRHITRERRARERVELDNEALDALVAIRTIVVASNPLTIRGADRGKVLALRDQTFALHPRLGLVVAAHPSDSIREKCRTVMGTSDRAVFNGAWAHGLASDIFAASSETLAAEHEAALTEIDALAEELRADREKHG